MTVWPETDLRHLPASTGGASVSGLDGEARSLAVAWVGGGEVVPNGDEGELTASVPQLIKPMLRIKAATYDARSIGRA